MHQEKHKPGAVIPGLSMKGNTLIPFSKDSKKDMHYGMMHVYDHAFYGMHAHVIEIMKAIVEIQSKKSFLTFKKAIAKIHEASDDWGALKDAVSSYDAFACAQVALFKKKRLKTKDFSANAKLHKVVKKISHAQPALMYASGRVAHSRLLLAEYTQNHHLNTYLTTVEKTLKSNVVQKRFNTSDKHLVQVKNRLIALCVLLEGAVLQYCAVKEALVTEIEKQSLPMQQSIDVIIKEIHATLLG